MYDFRNFRKIKTFGRDIFEGNVTLDETNIERDNLLRDIRSFHSRTRPQNDAKMQQKILEKNFLKTCINFVKQEKYFLMILKIEYF